MDFIIIRSNMYRKASLPDWYNMKTARETTDPEILRKILERGENDIVSRNAAINLNCPPDVLRMVLERGKDDQVSWYAAENPSCPPEALRMVLERGKNDNVSWYAAGNINCSSDALKMVLERGKNDMVSRHAYENPNIPFEGVLKWMRATGQITVEDPAKHLIDYGEQPKQRSNKDLEELERLLQGKSFSLKKIAQKYYDIEEIESTRDPELLREILKNSSRDSMGSYYATKNPNCPPDALKMVLERGINDDASWNAVSNPNCPPDVLKMVLERGNSDAVSMYAAQNPNCPPDVLRMVIKRGNNDRVSRGVVSNPNCPPDALKMVLDRGKNDDVSWYAARNPNCPPDALKMVLESGTNNNVALYAVSNPNCPPDLIKMIIETRVGEITLWAISNPNCPPETLKDVLDRGQIDKISWSAHKNPNAPFESVLQWMRATGQITVEDPAKHLIDYGEQPKQKSNKDLEEFERLLQGKSFSLKKIAQDETYYNQKVARETTDPEILRKILARGNDDWVSWEAAENRNCSPDVLKKILQRGENDRVSWAAAKNPNCPPDALKMVLEKGKDDYVSYDAVQNPNCPVEVLNSILKRGKDDSVSLGASENPNAPIDSVLQWMRAIGKITKEDPSIHFIDQPEPKPKSNKDLEELERLLQGK